MPHLKRHRVLAALLLYLQAALVAPAASIVISSNGVPRVESDAAHLTKWHGVGHVAHPNMRGCSSPDSDDSSEHVHTHFAEFDSGADAANAAAAPPPAEHAGPPVAATPACGSFSCQEAADLARLDARPPDRSAAVDSDFALIVLNV